MKHLLTSLLTGRLVLALCLLLGLNGLIPEKVQAQQTEPTPEPQVIVYIVQAGDTLFGIAQEFGVSIEVLAAVNNIADPSQLAVGQRLIIPPPAAPQEPSYEHIVQAGETLHELGLRYHTNTQTLAQANHLVRPDMLAINQTLYINNHTEPAPPLPGRTMDNQTGQTLLELALGNDSSPWALAAANQLDSPLAVPAGRQIWLPGPEGTYFDWPAPFAGIQLHPVPAVQGETVSIQISLTQPISLSGSFMGSSLRFHTPITGTAAVALLGIPALAEAGAPTLFITATQSNQAAAYFAQTLPVLAGDYYSESIVVADNIAAQMTAEVVQNETDTLDRIFALDSPVRHWHGFFNLPAAGDITSVFGTRRTYNIPNASAYHTGTDFGRNQNAPVYAPAAGVVVFAEPLIVRGNVVVIDHGWGVMTGYWHLSASYVSPGDEISRGQHIGDVGNTGLSTGPHLHWEMRVGGVPTNGLQWVRVKFP